MRLLRGRVGAVVFALACLSAADARAELRAIDVDRSTLTVFVYKSGLFSALADNHVIRAPIANGTISETAPLSVSLTVRSAALRVLDPNLSADRRAEVQTRMLGSEVLDTTTFPEIVFVSTSIVESGRDAWQVTGNLTLHGKTRSITVSVTRVNAAYRGAATIRQRDFGIEPIRVAGGTVRVKDELRIEFDIR